MGLSSPSAPLLLVLLSLFPAAGAGDGNGDASPLLPSAEQEAAYLALEAVDPAVQWRSLYPDDLCLSGPHGLVCDFLSSSPSTPHVAELNFGFVSDFSSNPVCSPSASLAALLSAAAALPFLRKLFLYDCFGSETRVPLSASLANFSSPALEELVLIRNHALVGHLGGSIGNFPRLRRLIISGSRISGIIPPEIGKLRKLEQLVLAGNCLRGPIPASIGLCRSLKVLDLSSNRIKGRLPIEIGRLEELVKLDLSSNHITGPIPVQFGRLNRLELLDLTGNSLTGGVPAALAEMTSLKELYLSGNRLGGPIPEIWEQLGGILGIGMSGLGLEGNIPASMGVFLGKVRYLALDNNYLEGELPDQLKGLEKSAREINLQNNALGGRIPFSAAFAARVGGKLKLGGNPNLCLGEDIAEPTRGRSNLGYLKTCNKTEIPYPVLFSSFGLYHLKIPSNFAIFVIFLLLL